MILIKKRKKINFFLYYYSSVTSSTNSFSPSLVWSNIGMSLSIIASLETPTLTGIDVVELDPLVADTLVVPSAKHLMITPWAFLSEYVN